MVTYFQACLRERKERCCGSVKNTSSARMPISTSLKQLEYLFSAVQKALPDPSSGRKVKHGKLVTTS
jgi:hypothetical protein